MIEPVNLHANDAFQCLKHRSGANPIERIGPLRAFSQVHGIVVSIGEAESDRNPSGCVETQRVDQLLAEQPHGGCTEDDNPLLVQSDDPLVRTKIEQFREVQVPSFRRVVAG